MGAADAVGISDVGKASFWAPRRENRSPGKAAFRAKTGGRLDRREATRTNGTFRRRRAHGAGGRRGRGPTGWVADRCWNYISGMITASITWITPFEASMSGVTTLASFTMTPPSVMIVTSEP